MTEGGDPYDDPNLKGVSRYFNNSTIRGRANTAIATLAGVVLFFVYKKFSGKKAEN